MRCRADPPVRHVHRRKCAMDDLASPSQAYFAHERRIACRQRPSVIANRNRCAGVTTLKPGPVQLRRSPLVKSSTCTTSRRRSKRRARGGAIAGRPHALETCAEHAVAPAHLPPAHAGLRADQPDVGGAALRQDLVPRQPCLDSAVRPAPWPDSAQRPMRPRRASVTERCAPAPGIAVNESLGTMPNEMNKTITGTGSAWARPPRKPTEHAKRDDWGT